MLLLNCKSCDDVLKLVDKTRTCECGQSSGRLDNETPQVVGALARLLNIPWEDYDSVAAGLERRWFLCGTKNE